MCTFLEYHIFRLIVSDKKMLERSLHMMLEKEIGVNMFDFTLLYDVVLADETYKEEDGDDRDDQSERYNAKPLLSDE